MEARGHSRGSLAAGQGHPGAEGAPPRSERAGAPGGASMGWTVAIAIAAPLLVFLALAWTTSDPAGRRENIPAWVSGARVLKDAGSGVRFEIGPRPIALLYGVRNANARYTSLTFDLFLRDPVEPQARVLTRRTGGEKDYRAADFTLAIERAGWNPIAITADEAPGLPGADELGLFLESPSPNVVAVRGARLEGFPFPARARQMAEALLRRQPLVASSINAVPSQRVAGRGFGFLLWAGGAIALGALLLRRLVLRERFSILLHAAITVVVLYALADLRNGTDLFMNAREAAASRLEAGTVDEYLARRERVFPWFADAVRTLRTRVHPGASAWLQVEGPPFLTAAANRAWYYGQPARRAPSLAEADVAMFWGAGPDPLAGRTGWILADRTPGGLVVYERNR